jgi:2-polyprenyl-6-methoxyphenol hydroxylase-like FAD-dependent oxidoreductase
MITGANDAAIDAAHKSGDLAEQKKAWAEYYQDGGWETPRFMKELLESPQADDLYFRPFEEVRLPKQSWSSGRVVMIGDAAHSSTADGFGCTWSLVGAYILAGEIATMLEKDKSSTTAAVVQAAKNYEEKFRPISTAKQGGSQKFESLTFPRSKTGIWVLHTFARAAAFLKLDQGIGMLVGMSDWKIPEYPLLEKVHSKA